MIDFIVLFIPIVAFWFAGVTGIPQYVKLLNRKPFTCPKCMAFWIAFVYQMSVGCHGWSAWMIICVSSLCAWLIEVIIQRLHIPYNR